MHYIHRFDPVAFQLGGIEFHWYWLAYLFGFIWVFYAGQKLISQGYGNISATHFVKMCWISWVALFLGSRIFYIFVYNWDYYLEHPSAVFKIWAGGMSFHGGLLGVIGAVFLMARHLKISLFYFTDLLAILAPLGLMLGRVGNFINGELVGRVTQVPWAVIFSRTADFNPRHPSQLYAAFFEGLLPFIVLYGQKKYLSIKAYQSTLFLLLYGIGRFAVGLFRAPDPQIGMIGVLTLGQVLCLAMIGAAVILEFFYRPLRLRLEN